MASTLFKLNAILIVLYIGNTLFQNSNQVLDDVKNPFEENNPVQDTNSVQDSWKDQNIYERKNPFENGCSPNDKNPVLKNNIKMYSPSEGSRYGR